MKYKSLTLHIPAGFIEYQENLKISVQEVGLEYYLVQTVNDQNIDEPIYMCNTEDLFDPEITINEDASLTIQFYSYHCEILTHKTLA